MKVLILKRLLVILGILNAGYLILVQTFFSGVCSETLSCQEVLTSVYSKVVGVPLSVLGLGYFIVLFLVFFSTDKRGDDAKATDHFLMVFLGLGCIVGMSLMILQWLVIGHVCLFCMVNHAIVLALAILTVAHFWSSFSWLSAYQGAKLWAVMLLLCFLVPILGYKLMDQTRFQTFLGIETPQRVVAIIDGQKIALSDVDRDIQITLADLEWRKYEARLEELNEQLIEWEAGGLKSRVRQLIQENVLSNMRVTQDDYNAYYDQLKPVHSTLSEQAFRKKVQETLNEDTFKAQLSIYIQTLKKKYNVDYMLPKPQIVSVRSGPYGHPVKGNPDALNTIIMFGDLLCLHCAKAHAFLDAFVDKYSDSIKLIYRHFPIGRKEDSFLAALTATSAYSQGAFWAYIDKVYNGIVFNDVQARIYAKECGLDLSLFNRYKFEDRFREMVVADIHEGKRIGVTNTPTLVINGRFFKGVPTERDMRRYLPSLTNNK